MLHGSAAIVTLLLIRHVLRHEQDELAAGILLA
jgi:hypothetical protein